MRRKLLLLLVACISFSGYAQTHDSSQDQSQNQCMDLPQVFSPNAAELGKYGKIPMSYFNGLPNISIPLTELKAKGYTLPIYLTYHAGGNRPDQHPGWVGLGWTLHAGGCITRIVRGFQDELGSAKSAFLNSGTGYLYHADSLQSRSIDAVTLMNKYSNGLYHSTPDEFLVNFDGLTSSFYIVGNNAVKIVSESDVDYSVEIELEPSAQLHEFQRHETFAMRYESIKTIRITSSDGTIYCFGGSDDANDHCYDLLSNLNGATTLERTTDTWNISSIRFPSGEEIQFEYVKAGRPIVTSSQTYHAHCAIDPLDPGDPYGDNYNTSKTDLSYSLISPSYLHRIRSIMSGEELSFTISRTNELAEKLDDLKFRKNFIIASGPTFEECVEQNYYQKLTRIDSPRGSIYFEYTDSPLERLKLHSVSFGNPTAGKYEMLYNALSLPEYHSRKTDIWGFYSQIQTKDETGYYHPVDSISARAEMLEVLRYPTGGETRFDYELHHYGQVANQYPFMLITENGTAGGLRIRKITDVSDGKESSRSFRYITESGSSSGISAIKTRCTAKGRVALYPFDPIIIQGSATLSFNNTPPGPNEVFYEFSGERPLNQIPKTKGSHVTYSRVEECFSDSGKIVYQYTNHEEYPDSSFLWAVCNFEDFGLYNSYCSHELSRGLLKKREVFSAGSSSPVLVEDYDYYRDLSENLQGIESISLFKGVVRRSAYVLYYTYFPGLRQKTITVFPENNGIPHVETIEYVYDSHRRLTETSRTVNGITERETISYTGNYSTQPYSGMREKNMIAYPVEHLIFQKDALQSEKVVSAELNTWKLSDTLFVPAAKYRASLGSGMTLSVMNGPGFHPLDSTGQIRDASYGSLPELSFTKHDRSGNLVLAEDDSGLSTTYVWTPDGCHPAAIFAGAKMGYSQRDSSDVTKYEQANLKVGDVLVRDFECLEPFTMTLDLTCPRGQNWHLRVILDNDEYPLTVINSSYTQSTWSKSGYGQYPYCRQVHVPSGTHRLKIIVRPTYYAGQSTDPIGCSLMFNFNEKHYTTQNYPGDTVLFEDFEKDGNVTEKGYCSDRSHRGTWTHTLNDSNGSYILDYQVYRNGTWNYVRQAVSGPTVSIREGTAPIDHIRVYPERSLPESYTWDKAGNLLSRTDARGMTERFEYDGLGRLSCIYDNDGKKVEEYKYNYKNK